MVIITVFQTVDARSIRATCTLSMQDDETYFRYGKSSVYIIYTK